jgi:hypothetical protein
MIGLPDGQVAGSLHFSQQALFDTAAEKMRPSQRGLPPATQACSQKQVKRQKAKVVSALHFCQLPFVFCFLPFVF